MELTILMYWILQLFRNNPGAFLLGPTEMSAFQVFESKQ